MAEMDKEKIVKLSIAGLLFVAAIVLISMQFLGGSAPQESPAAKAAAERDAAVNQAAQEQAKTVELQPELPRESRAPRTVLGR